MAAYDQAARKKAVRQGRQKGCSIYIAAEELRDAGYGDVAEVFYRVWATSEGGLQVRLYRKR
jgi:hypothetical protein